MTQKILVIKIDARNKRNRRSQDIRRIESSTQADFENPEVHVNPGKIFKCYGRHTLKVCRMRAEVSRSEELFDQRLDPHERFRKVAIVDFLAVHSNAFIDSFQVWRCVQSRAETGVPQNRFEERSRRALAVGPGNVRRGIRAIGPAQALG